MARKQSRKQGGSLADVYEAVRQMKDEGRIAPSNAQEVESALFNVGEGLPPRHRTAAYIEAHLDEILARHAKATGISEEMRDDYRARLTRGLRWFAELRKKPDWSGVSRGAPRRSSKEDASLADVYEAVRHLKDEGLIAPSTAQGMESALFNVGRRLPPEHRTAAYVEAHLDEIIARHAKATGIPKRTSGNYRSRLKCGLRWFAELEKNPDWKGVRRGGVGTNLAPRIREKRARARARPNTLWLSKLQLEALHRGEPFDTVACGKKVRVLPVGAPRARRSGKAAKA